MAQSSNLALVALVVVADAVAAAAALPDEAFSFRNDSKSDHRSSSVFLPLLPLAEITLAALVGGGGGEEEKGEEKRANSSPRQTELAGVSRGTPERPTLVVVAVLFESVTESDSSSSSSCW